MPPTLVAARKPREHPPVAPLRLAPSSRRRPALAVASLLLAVVCAALFATAYSKAGHQISVLAVARPISEGSVIVASDLTSVRASLSSGVNAVPESNAASVVGRTAAVDLVPGSLLVENDVTLMFEPPQGDALVGVALKPGLLPAQGLAPGEAVDIVLTGIPGAPDTATGSSSVAETGTEPSLAPGTVLSSDVVVKAVTLASDSSGAIDVSVLVPSTIAPLIANASAAGQAALVVVSPSS